MGICVCASHHIRNHHRFVAALAQYCSALPSDFVLSYVRPRLQWYVYASTYTRWLNTIFKKTGSTIPRTMIIYKKFVLNNIFLTNVSFDFISIAYISMPLTLTNATLFKINISHKTENSLAQVCYYLPLCLKLKAIIKSKTPHVSSFCLCSPKGGIYSTTKAKLYTFVHNSALNCRNPYHKISSK